MDPIFAQRQPGLWAGQGLHHENVIQMEYSTYPHPPPFTSPPATPMTPHHHTAFAIPQYEQPMVPIHYANPLPPPPPCLPPLPDYRLYALCQHLQSYPQVSEANLKLWWDEFMSEFFHENATLAIEVDLGDGMRKFCLTREWIVCYFKSMMENGVTTVHMNLGPCISTFHHSMQQLDCRNAAMEMDVLSPQVAKICTIGSLILDYSLEEKPRIISWYFNIKDHVEYIPRRTHTTSEEAANITCKGILPATQKFLMTASMMESGVQDPLALPSSTAGPTDISTTQWQELHPTLEDGNLQAFSTTVTTGSLPPPPLLSSPLLHSQTQASSASLPSCSKAKPFRPPCTRKGKTSPTAKTNQFVLVATDAVPLTAVEDLLFGVVGEVERTITRVDNQCKPAKVKPLDSCPLPTVAEDNATYTTSLSHPPIWPTDAHGEQGTLSAIR